VKETDGVRASVNASSDSATLGKARRSDDKATVKEKPVEVKASKDEQEQEVSSALTFEKEDTIQLGKPERTLDVSSVKEAKSAKLEITTQQYHEAKAKVIEQIEEIAATRGNGKVTIRLNPDDLGTITLAVRSFGDNVEAKVTASNDNVRQALHTHRADLVQSVESRGLSMNSFTVGSESNADAQQQGNGKQQGQDMRQEFARSHNLWGNRHDQTPAPRPMFQRLRYAGVDTFA
jgi:flagellar hook-length control protein FliK